MLIHVTNIKTTLQYRKEASCKKKNHTLHDAYIKYKVNSDQR